ncbi:uncharacterized protein [Choristoneura fumiferana]|uniref:uncharacterized protein n=1 Tax=Choristoneura fumiferana TaxID=7141 RepID=UPI003D155EDE
MEDEIIEYNTSKMEESVNSEKCHIEINEETKNESCNACDEKDSGIVLLEPIEPAEETVNTGNRKEVSKHDLSKSSVPITDLISNDLKKVDQTKNNTKNASLESYCITEDNNITPESNSELFPELELEIVCGKNDTSNEDNHDIANNVEDDKMYNNTLTIAEKEINGDADTAIQAESSALHGGGPCRVDDNMPNSSTSEKVARKSKKRFKKRKKGRNVNDTENATVKLRMEAYNVDSYYAADKVDKAVENFNETFVKTERNKPNMSMVDTKDTQKAFRCSSISNGDANEKVVQSLGKETIDHAEMSKNDDDIAKSNQVHADCDNTDSHRENNKIRDQIFVKNSVEAGKESNNKEKYLSAVEYVHKIVSESERNEIIMNMVNVQDTEKSFTCPSASNKNASGKVVESLENKPIKYKEAITEITPAVGKKPDLLNISETYIKVDNKSDLANNDNHLVFDTSTRNVTIEDNVAKTNPVHIQCDIIDLNNENDKPIAQSSALLIAAQNINKWDTDENTVLTDEDINDRAAETDRDDKIIIINALLQDSEKSITCSSASNEDANGIVTKSLENKTIENEKTSNAEMKITIKPSTEEKLNLIDISEPHTKTVNKMNHANNETDLLTEDTIHEDNKNNIGEPSSRKKCGGDKTAMIIKYELENSMINSINKTFVTTINDQHLENTIVSARNKKDKGSWADRENDKSEEPISIKMSIDAHNINNTVEIEQIVVEAPIIIENRKENTILDVLEETNYASVEKKENQTLNGMTHDEDVKTTTVTLTGVSLCNERESINIEVVTSLEEKKNKNEDKSENEAKQTGTSELTTTIKNKNYKRDKENDPELLEFESNKKVMNEEDLKVEQNVQENTENKATESTVVYYEITEQMLIVETHIIETTEPEEKVSKRSVSCIKDKIEPNIESGRNYIDKTTTNNLDAETSVGNSSTVNAEYNLKQEVTESKDTEVNDHHKSPNRSTENINETVDDFSQLKGNREESKVTNVQTNMKEISKKDDLNKENDLVNTDNKTNTNHLTSNVTAHTDEKCQQLITKHALETEKVVESPNKAKEVTELEKNTINNDETSEESKNAEKSTNTAEEDTIEFVHEKDAKITNKICNKNNQEVSDVNSTGGETVDNKIAIIKEIKRDVNNEEVDINLITESIKQNKRRRKKKRKKYITIKNVLYALGIISIILMFLFLVYKVYQKPCTILRTIHHHYEISISNMYTYF